MLEGIISCLNKGLLLRPSTLFNVMPGFVSGTMLEQTDLVHSWVPYVTWWLNMESDYNVLAEIDLRFFRIEPSCQCQICQIFIFIISRHSSGIKALFG